MGHPNVTKAWERGKELGPDECLSMGCMHVRTDTGRLNLGGSGRYPISDGVIHCASQQ
jgi:hypothetical protein